MVDGDICEHPPDQDAAAELGGAAEAPERSKGLVGAWPTPVGCGEDNLVWLSDWSASSTDDAAPRASSMTKLRPKPPEAAPLCIVTDSISKRCASGKTQQNRAFLPFDVAVPPAIDAANGRIFRAPPGRGTSSAVRGRSGVHLA